MRAPTSGSADRRAEIEAARARGLAKHERRVREDALQGLREGVTFTAAELLAVDLPEPRFVIEGLLPIGLTYLSGVPKVGKSYLALQAAISVSTGVSFLGRDVDAGPVAYLALEDNERRLQGRLKEFGAPAEAHLEFAVEWPAIMKRGRSGAWQLARGLTQLRGCIEKRDTRLVVIDTFAQVVPGIDHDDYSMITSALSPLHTLALERDMAIVVIDHQNKGASRSDRGPDLSTDILGSTAKAGSADTLWGLYGATGGTPARLIAKGRELLAVEFLLARDDSQWTVREDARDTAKTDAENAVIALLVREGCAMTVPSVAEALELERSTVQRRLKKMTDEGLIHCEARPTDSGGTANWYSLSDLESDSYSGT